MTRDEFREGVFARDGNKCVICGRNDLPLDAHHIIERRLWDDGGYYLDNGATLCDDGVNGCHYKAETTEITVEQIRDACGITKIVLPENMYHDTVYDKWGNVYLENGKRTNGPLMNDESVRYVLNKYLDEFTFYVKYPRTYHLPWSEGINDDDKTYKSMESFVGKEVIVTEKMDGENTSVYFDYYYHARSVDGRSHYTRDWAKTYASNYISPNLPYGWRISCENMYAKHSIKYENLPSYLIGISIWNDKNICLSYDETVEWFKLLNMPMTKTLYRGIYDEAKIKSLYSDKDYDSMEGYVIRVSDSFHFKDFHKSVGKFVRKNHVQTTKHWMFGAGRTHELNELKDGLTLDTIKYEGDIK